MMRRRTSTHRKVSGLRIDFLTGTELPDLTFCDERIGRVRSRAQTMLGAVRTQVASHLSGKCDIQLDL